MQGQQADLEWRDGKVPVSTRFDDPYFSLENGLAETCHVFLGGNALPERFVPGFHIAELGFGTGLNFLAAWHAWEVSGCSGSLRFTSFEVFPMRPADMGKALSVFPELASLAERMLSTIDEKGGHFDFGSACLEVIVADARQALPAWTGAANAWFLDGFSPAKNPELWTEDLMRDVARRTRPGGTVATYTAAGFVRRGLDAAGFDVVRRPGFGRKRHMTTGTLR